MFSSSLLVKMWQHSRTWAVLRWLGRWGVAVVAGSRLVALVWADWSAWRAGSVLCRGINQVVVFSQGLLTGLRKLLTPALANSGVVALAGSGWNGSLPWFAIGLGGGVGLAWLLGGLAESPMWLALGGAALVAALAMAWLWPRRLDVWPDSLLGRLWLALTVVED